MAEADRAVEAAAFIESISRECNTRLFFPMPERGRRFWTVHWWRWTLSVSYRARLRAKRLEAMQAWCDRPKQAFNRLAARYDVTWP